MGLTTTDLVSKRRWCAGIKADQAVVDWTEFSGNRGGRTPVKIVSVATEYCFVKLVGRPMLGRQKARIEHILEHIDSPPPAPPPAPPVRVPADERPPERDAQFDAEFDRLIAAEAALKAAAAAAPDATPPPAPPAPQPPAPPRPVPGTASPDRDFGGFGAWYIVDTDVQRAWTSAHGWLSPRNFHKARPMKRWGDVLNTWDELTTRRWNRLSPAAVEGVKLDALRVMTAPELATYWDVAVPDANRAPGGNGDAAGGGNGDGGNGKVGYAVAAPRQMLTVSIPQAVIDARTAEHEAFALLMGTRQARERMEPKIADARRVLDEVAALDARVAERAAEWHAAREQTERAIYATLNLAPAAAENVAPPVDEIESSADPAAEPAGGADATNGES